MSALEGLKNSIRRWGGSDDDESYSNELESAKEEPVQQAVQIGPRHPHPSGTEKISKRIRMKI